MRTTEDYKKLVEGYSFSMSILKLLKPKLYDKIFLAKDLLDQRGDKFNEFIRHLRVDFINKKDEIDAGIPLLTTFNYGLYKEDLALNYMPSEGFSLGILYEKKSIIRDKKVFCEIFPTTLEDIEKNTVVPVMRISTLDNNESEKPKIKRAYNYIAGIAEDSLMILMQDDNNPKVVKPGLEIPLGEIGLVYKDLSNVY